MPCLLRSWLCVYLIASGLWLCRALPAQQLQPPPRLLHPPVSQPLPQFQRSAVVVYADEFEIHGVMNLCIELKPFAAHATIAAQNANAAMYAARRPRHPALHRAYNNTVYSTHITIENKIFGSLK